MKKIFILAAVLLSLQLQAQIKEGTIKYKTTMFGGPSGSSVIGQTVMIIYFNKEKSLTEMATPAYGMRTLTDSKGMLMLMEGRGSKMYSRKTNEEIEADKRALKVNEPVVTIQKEKKNILGYECTKAIVVTKTATGVSSSTTIWYTDKIQCVAASGIMNMDALKKLKGMPLEVEMQQGPMKSTMTAIEVSSKPVAPNTFVLSTAGYTEQKAAPRFQKPVAPKR